MAGEFKREEKIIDGKFIPVCIFVSQLSFADPMSGLYWDDRDIDLSTSGPSKSYVLKDVETGKLFGSNGKKLIEFGSETKSYKMIDNGYENYSFLDNGYIIADIDPLREIKTGVFQSTSDLISPKGKIVLKNAYNLHYLENGKVEYEVYKNYELIKKVKTLKSKTIISGKTVNKSFDSYLNNEQKQGRFNKEYYFDDKVIEKIKNNIKREAEYEAKNQEKLPTVPKFVKQEENNIESAA
jgi:hypothetical protein